MNSITDNNNHWDCTKILFYTIINQGENLINFGLLFANRDWYVVIVLFIFCSAKLQFIVFRG